MTGPSHPVYTPVISTTKGTRATSDSRRLLAFLNTPRLSPDFTAYRYLKRAIETNNTTVLTALLIDFIRIANHITERDNNAPTTW